MFFFKTFLNMFFFLPEYIYIVSDRLQHTEDYVTVYKSASSLANLQGSDPLRNLG